MVEILRQHYPDRNGDARTVVSAMLKSSGMLTIDGDYLMVSIDPQSSPKRAALMQKICDNLNTRKVLYPGSKLILRFKAGI